MKQKGQVLSVSLVKKECIYSDTFFLCIKLKMKHLRPVPFVSFLKLLLLF